MQKQNSSCHPWQRLYTAGIDPGKHTLTSHAEYDNTIELDDRLEKITMFGKS